MRWFGSTAQAELNARNTNRKESESDRGMFDFSAPVTESAHISSALTSNPHLTEDAWISHAAEL
jgi:hypothetical protein